MRVLRFSRLGAGRGRLGGGLFWEEEICVAGGRVLGCLWPAVFRRGSLAEKAGDNFRGVGTCRNEHLATFVCPPSV
jgi:hypothetical protein